MLISLHLPKTAGTSFAAALESRFGPRLLRDYADLPINTPRSERHAAAFRAGLAMAETGGPDAHCIHGHFLPVKYLPLADRRDVRFITWIRDPVARVLSHYYYWQRTYNPQSAPTLHRKVMEEGWSVERFCLGPELRNLYCQFLWAFPLENFEFIGVTEYYDEDLTYFARRYLGTTVEPVRLNGAAAEPPVPASLRDEIAAAHADDVALYQRALARRRSRPAAADQPGIPAAEYS
ncbi:MAG: hypothetical protein ACJ8F7_20910 [Gemmataceae bacterium]